MNKVNDRGKIFLMEAVVDKTDYIDFGMILARMNREHQIIVQEVIVVLTMHVLKRKLY